MSFKWQLQLEANRSMKKETNFRGLHVSIGGNGEVFEGPAAR
jgi:hypothetical protein